MLNCYLSIIANCEKIKSDALEAAQNVDIPTEASVVDLAVNKNTKNPTTETHNSNKKRKKSVEGLYIFFALVCWSSFIFINIYYNNVAEVIDTKRPNSPTTAAKASTEKKQKTTKKEKEKKKTTGRHKGYKLYPT